MNCKTVQEMIKQLRKRREKECFSVINRGRLWYDYLTNEQRIELANWYNDWLDVTETLIVPKQPKWLNDKLDREDVL